MIANHNIDHSTMQSDDDARLLHLVLELNRAITRSVSSTDLFENICRIIDLYEEFPICWVGQPDMRTRNFNPIATTNLSKQDLHVLQTSKFEDGGPTKKSLERNGHIIFVNDISTENKSSPLIKFCNDRGIRSFLTIPFSGNDHVVYNLNLCSTRAEAFSDVRLSLFNGLAEDLSYALANLNEKDARKNLEAALNEKTKVFERSEAISRSGSFKVDIKRRTCVWSLEGRRIFDFHISETEILYSDWVDTILPDDLERVRSKMYLAIEETTVADIVYRIRIKNGSIRHIRSIAAFERNENNEPISMYCAITDITKQTEISSDLSKAQHNLASILDSIPLAVALKNRSGAYDYANQKFADLFGVSANKLIKLKAEEIARSYPKNEVLTEMDRDVFENGVVVQKNEIEFVDNLGKKHFFNVTKSLFMGVGEQENNVLKILQDISEQKKYEAERSALVEDLQRRINHLEQFSYVISHNIRGPLSTILGIADFCIDPEPSPDDKQMMLAAVKEKALQIDSVLLDLNHILSVQNGENIRENVSLSAILDRVKQTLKQAIHDNHTIILENFETDSFYTIPSYLESIFYNIISNSIKYKMPNAPAIIEIECNKIAHGIELVFKDNGMGIDMTKFGNKLFGLYKRFHNHVPGTGVGLYLVKCHIEALGGHINLFSKVAQGTKIFIYLPN